MAVTALPITALFAGILGFVIAAANLGVVLTRIATNKFYGAEHNSTLEFRSRGAGTITEFSAIGLPFLALLEFNELLSPRALWWWGFVFAATRIAHGIQLANPRSVPLAVRGASMFTTLVLIASASITLFSFALKQ